jgi:flavodoxin
MKYLIVYFSMTGRTRKMAFAIASTLQGVEIQLEELKFEGRNSEYRHDQMVFEAEDLKKYICSSSILDLAEYDQIFFGTPTYGGRPAIIFKVFLDQVKNLAGKEVAVFATGRIMPGNVFTIMQKWIEEKGGKVKNVDFFKGFFTLNPIKATTWVQSFK